ncbi:MAG: hypothetical protein QOD76_2192 [Solirubrobacteraceae bacterium]|nr:hypothetical protein [Solirubrobacteraceae bacterium]
MKRRFRSGRIQGGGVSTAVVVALALGLAPSAQAHVLAKSRAVNAARGVAANLATRRAGDTSQPTFSGPSCKRRSRHRFVCTTTVRGSAGCDAAETACEPVPWELSYVITVKFRGAGSALSVSTQEA